MLNKIKSAASLNISNAQGWRTNRKIIVIESDDWGSIRIPDKGSLDFLYSKGFNIEKCPYVMNDSLESNEDLKTLFEFIESRKKQPIITANFLTANPNFEKIKDSNFTKYFSESLEVTLNDYPNHDNVKNLYFQGISKKYFVAQLHGREHLNISQWMSDLNLGNKETHEAFERKVFGISAHIVNVKRNSYQAAFGRQNCDFNVNHNQVIKEAFFDFEKLFGYRSKTFIAPNYTWGDELEKTTADLGITHLQGGRAQLIPVQSCNKLQIRRNFLGKKNKYGQKYLIRNVSFEPFMSNTNDCVNKALSEIRNAFFWNKPAIISMHRVNFIGSINKNNRVNNLKLFNNLLNKIDQHWPDVEYLSSKDISKLI